MAKRHLPRWRPGLVTRFALASLLAFVGIGAAVSIITTRSVLRTQEDNAQMHAEFVGNAVLRDRLPLDVGRQPLRGDELRALDRFVRSRILLDPVVRVKVWSTDGVILYSDDPRLIGMMFPGEPDAREGDEVESEVTDLEERENRFERSLAPKLFSTYVPLHLAGTEAGPPDVVVELYQDYADIESKALDLERAAIAAIGLGLVFLYLLLLPILRGAAARLRRQNDQLEEQAKRLQQQAERLEVALAREQETVAELTRVNRMKDDFVAVASHELRTPLTAILGYVKTLRRPEFERDPGARAEFLAAVERQGDRLFRLITNLLTASQVERGDATAELRDVDLLELAEEVCEGFHAGRGRLSVRVPPGLVVSSDPLRLGEILANLVDNAIKYSPPASPVEVGAEREGDEVRIWVRDHGVGIGQDDVERIFERFYQTDQTSTRRVGGVGLGLHLVKQLVAELGGSVGVESEPGVGSTFTVRLPVSLEAARGGDAASRNGHGRNAQGGRGAGEGRAGDVPDRERISSG